MLKRANNKKIISWIAVTVFIALFLVVKPANAGWVLDLFGGICMGLVSAFGWVLMKLMGVLIYIAQYNNFIASKAVINGWVMVRDICNMFFVLILLIIAFATILHIESYNYKKWLPKLILMAILINFSKTICGVLIDVSQIVMLTFVNAFKDIGGVNLTDILGIKDWQSLKGIETVSGWEVAAAYVLAVIYVVISIIVIAAMIAMLVMRIVMIWIYVVLSPAAYLLSAFPGGQKYASEWWSEFIKNLIIGPVLAFFIWLSFTSLANFDKASLDIKGTLDEGIDCQDTNNTGVCDFGTSDLLIKFIISIGMLLGGMKITQDIGGVAGKAAGGVFSKGKKWAVGGAMGAGGLALLGAKKLATGDNYFARKFAKSTGWDFRPIKLKESVKASFAKSKKDDERDIREKSKRHFEAGGFRSVAMGMGVGQDYFDRHIDGFLGYKGIKRAAKETFVNPAARKKIGGEIDTLEGSLEALKENRSTIIENKKPLIDAKIKQDLGQDQELQTLRQQKFQNSMDIAALKNKPGRTKQDEDDLKKLEEGKDAIDRKITKKEEEVKEKSTKEFLESDLDVAPIEAEIKVNEDGLKKLKDDIMQVQKPMAIEARTLYRKDVEEAKAKYKSITNSDELQKAFTDAQKRGNKFDQIAILEKLSNDANLNEEMKSKGYDSTAKGLYSYINNLDNIDGEKKGLSGKFSKAERVQILNDLGETEERVGHWDMAKMVGMNSKGEMESLVKEKKDANGNVVLDDLEHATHAYAEVIKMDPQKIVNSLNRLAFGGEDGKGQFQISNLGKMIFKYLASSQAYEKNPGRILGNTAANLMSPNVLPILEKLMANDMNKFNEVITILKNSVRTKDTSAKPGDMSSWLRANGFDK